MTSSIDIASTSLQSVALSDVGRWKTIRLETAGYCYPGLSKKMKTDFGHGKPYLPYSNIFANSQTDLHHLKYVTIKKGESQNRVKKNDVFFTISSETPEDVGMSSVLLEDIGECYLNSFCVGWRCTTRDLIPSFLRYYFRSPIFRRHIVTLSQGITRFNLPKKYLKRAFILYPPRTEQKTIASILHLWDTAIEKTLALIEKKELIFLKIRRTLMHRCGGTLYQLGTLEDLRYLQLGRGNIISKQSIRQSPGEFPVYSSSVKHNGMLGKYAQFVFDRELISWSIDGGGHFFYRPKHKFSLTNVCGYITVDAKTLDCRFLAAQLQHLRTSFVFDYHHKAHLNIIRKIMRLKIPPLAEQKRIVHILDAAKREIDLLYKNIRLSRLQQKALLRLFFSPTHTSRI